VEPVAVNDPGEDVIVYEVGSPPVPAAKATEADPLLYERDVPTFVATNEVGAVGITPTCDHPKEVYVSIFPVWVLLYISPTAGDAGRDAVFPLAGINAIAAFLLETSVAIRAAVSASVAKAVAVDRTFATSLALVNLYYSLW
jgi:hypothetical protein